MQMVMWKRPGFMQHSERAPSCSTMCSCTSIALLTISSSVMRIERKWVDLAGVVDLLVVVTILPIPKKISHYLIITVLIY